jgi:hypothetical protein
MAGISKELQVSRSSELMILSCIRGHTSAITGDPYHVIWGVSTGMLPDLCGIRVS